MEIPDIRRGTTEDADRTAELIAASFHPLEVAAWLVPDPDDRARVLPANFRIFVEDALAHGEILLIEDNVGACAAAAVWLPYLTGPLPPPDGYETRLTDACGPFTHRFEILDQRFADCHPHTYPHHQLAYLATRPDLQGQGLGSALLRHHHRQLDAEKVPAFLIASNDKTRAFYEQHDYEFLGKPLQLPDGPVMWPMWREPHALTDVTGEG